MVVKRSRRFLLTIGLVVALVSGPGAAPVHADDGGGLLSGVGDIISAALAIPVGILQGTLSGPPILGTVGGALSGTLNTVSLALRGILRLAGVAIPIAAKAAPFIPLFL